MRLHEIMEPKTSKQGHQYRIEDPILVQDMSGDAGFIIFQDKADYQIFIDAQNMLGYGSAYGGAQNTMEVVGKESELFGNDDRIMSYGEPVPHDVLDNIKASLIGRTIPDFDNPEAIIAGMMDRINRREVNPVDQALEGVHEYWFIPD